MHREAGTWARRAGVNDVDHSAAMTSGPQVCRATGSRCADAQRKLAAVHRACASAYRFRCDTCNTQSCAQVRFIAITTSSHSANVYKQLSINVYYCLTTTNNVDNIYGLLLEKTDIVTLPRCKCTKHEKIGTKSCICLLNDRPTFVTQA